MLLGDVAHVRTGDKGDTVQIAVIAHRATDYRWLGEALTIARVVGHLPGLGAGVSARRIALPAQAALVFVLDHALGGGVTRSLSLDPHGKSLGMLLLDIDLTARTKERP